MKRFLSILAVVLVSASCFGQNRFESIFELRGGPGGKQDLSHYIVGIGYTYGCNFFHRALFIGGEVGVTIADSRKFYWIGMQSEYDAHSLKYLTPLSVKAIYAPLRGKYSPIVAVDLGYSFDLFNEKIYRNIKGFYYEPQVGVDIKSGRIGSVYFTLGLNVQGFDYNIDTQRQYESSLVKKHDYMKGISFHVGCRF